MQQRTLLGNNQQQRECKRKANPIHVNDEIQPLSSPRLPWRARNIKIDADVDRKP
jgi:hypothetical protein